MHVSSLIGKKTKKQKQKGIRRIHGYGRALFNDRVHDPRAFVYVQSAVSCAVNSASRYAATRPLTTQGLNKKLILSLKMFDFTKFATHIR